MNNIFEPIILSSGSHNAGTGRGCAMNVISWENGDTTITDYPACSERALSRIVQGVNDRLANSSGYLSPENSLIALDLGHRTVGTADHGLSDIELQRVYVRLAVHAARKVIHLNDTPANREAIASAEAWADDPSVENKKRAAAAAAAAADAAAAAAAAAAADAAAYAAAYAADTYAAAYAADTYAAGVGFRVTLAGELIDLFKELTGTSSPVVAPEVVSRAVENMLVRA